MSEGEKMQNPPIPGEQEFLRGITTFEQNEPRDVMYRVATKLLNQFWGQISDMADGLGVLLLTWNQAFYRYGLFNFGSLEICLRKNLERVERFRSRDISSLSDSDWKIVIDLFSDFLAALQIDDLGFSDANIRRYTEKDLTRLLVAWDVKHDPSSLESLFDSMKTDSRISSAVEYYKGNTPRSKRIVYVTVSLLSSAESRVLEREGLMMRSPVSVSKALHLLAPHFFPLWDQKIAEGLGFDYGETPAEQYFEFCKVIKAIAEKAKVYTNRTDKTLVKLIDEYNYSKYTGQWI